MVGDRPGTTRLEPSASDQTGMQENYLCLGKELPESYPGSVHRGGIVHVPTSRNRKPHKSRDITQSTQKNTVSLLGENDLQSLI